VVNDRIEHANDAHKLKLKENQARKIQEKAQLYGEQATVHYQSPWLDFKTRIELDGIKVNENEITPEIRSDIRATWTNTTEAFLSQQEITSLKEQILTKHSQAFQRIDDDGLTIDDNESLHADPVTDSQSGW
jgi:hypothetical protein